MLKIHRFHVSFTIQGVQFDEEYSLPYRTEEWELLTEEERLKNNLTHIQAAKGIIAKELRVGIGSNRTIDTYLIEYELEFYGNS